MNNDSRPLIDYTNKDYVSLREAMLALADEKLPEWTDHSANDLGVMLLELFAYMGDNILYYQDRIANESYLDTAVERRSLINLLRLIGYELRPPTAASADLTLLFKEDAKGPVTIATGTLFQTTAEATGEPVVFQYVRDAFQIDLDDDQNIPLITHTDGNRYKRFATLPVVQVDANIDNEILGSSDATVGQRFRFARVPLIQDSLEISVDEGNGAVRWQCRDSLLHSLSNDRHYMVRRDEEGFALVEFGDGRHGKIPTQGRNNITAAYRVGGGRKGNVPPYTIVKAVTPIDQLEHVFNDSPAVGGTDAESTEEAVAKGPQVFRAQQRAVTATDYEAHARAFGVGKARAHAASWNRIELFVAPEGGGQPTDTLKEDLRNYFEDKRVMTSIIDIRDPVYVNVCIQGTLEINAYYFTEQVQQRVSRAVAELLAFENVDFGYTLYLSKFYEAIEAIEGVASVYITHLFKVYFDPPQVEEPLPEDGKLDFEWNEIPCTQPVRWRQDAITGHWSWHAGERGTAC